MTRVRIGVLGLGAVTQSVHLPLLARRWDLFEIAAVADLSAERTTTVADRYGVAGRFTSRADLVAAHTEGTCPLDAVLVATTGTHGADVIALTDAGLAVLAEKPLALAETEIDAIDAAVAGGGRVQLGYMKEYDPATAGAARALAGRQVRAVTVEILHPTSGAQLQFARLLPPAGDVDPVALATAVAPTTTALDQALGADLDPRWRGLYEGVIIGSIVHDISLLRHLGHPITGVESAATWGASDAGPGSVEVLGELASGARLHLGWHFLPDYPDYRETVTFHHEGGSVSLVFSVPYLLNAPTVLTVVSRGEDGAEIRSEHRSSQQEAFENELTAFHALVTSGEQPFSGPVQGRADLVVAQRILARLGQRHGFTPGGESAAH
ncbi:Gfo/Idh/MocA family oxidoreductase [Ruania alkalisoli]|uniref:Gfo/Idh/MocA family oxidoreductase n=1 Tax=Ruania alkalisoli TaxID=2779775 RepID=A0A7M1SZ80_9MICO|nr:Gfo/Idh/MocA family oxidoreductase [Ruania alkalisoli]QOR72052.1 Gfo/Idh/MocA family oxidoreductase [Ruania alkalisoli]